MQNNNQLERLEAKTIQQHFLRILEQEFHLGPRIAAAVLEEAQLCLLGSSDYLQPGQMRVVLTRRGARHGQALSDTPTVTVTWTLDAGLEDRQVLRQAGVQALRRVRLQRLLDEALEQAGVATQEDLALALYTSLRTIKRDFAVLQRQGLVLPSRGSLQGIGRGQTHKAQIVGRWLQGETYDQWVKHTPHSLTSIQRYVRTFVQVVGLSQQGFADSQIALLVPIGLPLVRDYRAIYQQHDTPACRERLAAQLERLGQTAQKGAP
ncbi:MAG: DUF1670 domain-containing protein [Chloroflexota bacterium]|nr:MAG: DUF1670 domain-containing protein [Chloroflexota bacterium]